MSENNNSQNRIVAWFKRTSQAAKNSISEIKSGRTDGQLADGSYQDPFIFGHFGPENESGGQRVITQGATEFSSDNATSNTPSLDSILQAIQAQMNDLNAARATAEEEARKYAGIQDAPAAKSGKPPYSIAHARVSTYHRLVSTGAGLAATFQLNYGVALHDFRWPLHPEWIQAFREARAANASLFPLKQYNRRINSNPLSERFHDWLEALLKRLPG